MAEVLTCCGKGKGRVNGWQGEENLCDYFGWQRVEVHGGGLGVELVIYEVVVSCFGIFLVVLLFFVVVQC